MQIIPKSCCTGYPSISSQKFVDNFLGVIPMNNQQPNTHMHAHEQTCLNSVLCLMVHFLGLLQGKPVPKSKLLGTTVTVITTVQQRLLIVEGRVYRNIMQIVLVLTQKCWFVIPSSTFPAAGTWALTPLLAFTGTDGVTTTPFLTHSHPFN